ncbi:hypothetical protein [Labilithrix luteola]|nr:hypothetical protein [Labilithrix luteola]
MRHARWLLGACALHGTMMWGGHGSACMNVVERQLTPVEQILVAENELENGKTGEVISRVRAQFPNVRELGPKAPPLARRALRLFALALVRADGRLDGQLGWTRWANLEWAVQTLEELDALRPNEPRSQADLAEARIYLSRTRAEGVRVLEDLDRRDLLGSPFAYRALARARRVSGDDGGAQAALRRCAMMSTDKLRCSAGRWDDPT